MTSHIKADTSFRCTVCDAPKGAVNGWNLVTAGRSANGVLTAFCIVLWDDDAVEQVRSDPDPELEYGLTCGERCTHTLLSRWLESRTFSPAPVRAEAGGGAL